MWVKVHSRTNPASHIFPWLAHFSGVHIYSSSTCMSCSIACTESIIARVKWFTGAHLTQAWPPQSYTTAILWPCHKSILKKPFDKTTASSDIVCFLTVPQAYKYHVDLREHVWPNKVWQSEINNKKSYQVCDISHWICDSWFLWDITATYSIKIVGHNSRLPGIDIFCVTIKLPLITYSETDFMPPSSLVLSPFMEDYVLKPLNISFFLVLACKRQPYSRCENTSRCKTLVMPL